jgi:putative CocE/NonD family hydrolase
MEEPSESIPGTTSEARAASKPRRLARRIMKWILALLLGVLLLLAGIRFLFPGAIQSWVAAGLTEMLPHYLALRSGTGTIAGGLPQKETLHVPMRDGVVLATDLYLPTTPAPYPVIAVRTPYTKEEGKLVAEFFARYGYAVAIQDVRGRHASQGDFYPFRSEVTDGIDMTHWLKQQRWCNGKIGAFGGSYLGFTQWAMATGNPEITSIAPAFITANLYNGIYRAGAFGKLTFLRWCLTSYGRYGDMGGAGNIQKGYQHFPLAESDDVALRDVPFYDDWVSHPVPDSYWEALSVDHRFQELSAPAFLTAGWYDFFLEAQLQDFQLLQKTASSHVRENTKILVGPWNHSFFNPNQKGYGIRQGWLEVIPFEFVKEIKAWYDYSLKGIPNGWNRRAPLRLYVLGQNKWRDEQTWPPANVSDHLYYVHSGGKARSLQGDGSLDLKMPAVDEPSDGFSYDPRNPVPTGGGSHGLPESCGPVDQRDVERRPDVLVYSSAPLEKALLVVGPVKMRLFASSTSPDTDFTAKLVDVLPDGRAFIICEGVVRARYRNGLKKPEFLEPDKVYTFDIVVGSTAVLFQSGHRIRLEISSSNFPRYDPNPNTAGEIAVERNPVKASQHVWHNREYPSALILPVLPD